jgi:hypothetical protein
VANVGSLVKMFSLTIKKSKRKGKTFDPSKKLPIHVHLGRNPMMKLIP